MRPMPKSAKKLIRRTNESESSDESFDIENDPNLIHSTKRQNLSQDRHGRNFFSRASHRRTISVPPNIRAREQNKNVIEHSSSSENDDINEILNRRARSLAQKQLRQSPSKTLTIISPSRQRRSLEEKKKTTPKKKPTSLEEKKKTTPRKSGAADHRHQEKDSAGSSKRRKLRQPQKRIQTGVLYDIMSLQNRIDNLVPRLPFSRLIREILMKYSYNNGMLRITPEALYALQEVSEMYLTQLFQDAYLCTIHRNRVTLLVKDMKLVSALRNHVIE